MRAADRLDDFRVRQLHLRRMPHVKRILHFPGWMVLRLEEGVEIPEGRFDHRRRDFGKAHLEKRAACLLDNFSERVNLGRVDILRGEFYVVGTKFDFTPCAGFKVFGGEGVALDDLADTRLECLRSFVRDRNHALCATLYFCQFGTIGKQRSYPIRINAPNKLA